MTLRHPGISPTNDLVGLMPGCLRIILFLLLLYHSFKSRFTRFNASIYLFVKKRNFSK